MSLECSTLSLEQELSSIYYFKIYLDWLKYLSWFRYTNEIFIINQWKGVDDIKVNCQELDNGTEVCQYVTGEFVIEDQMGFNIVNN